MQRFGLLDKTTTDTHIMTMDIYGKEQYEKLDFITQAVEPFNHPIDAILAAFPESYEFSKFELIATIGRDGRTSISKSELIALAASQLNDKDLPKNRGHRLNDMLEGMFSIKTDGEVFIDVDTNELHGKVFLVKEGEQATEERKIDSMIQAMYSKINAADIDNRNSFIWDEARFIADLFKVAPTHSANSAAACREILKGAVGLIKSNKIRIRDYGLGIEVADQLVKLVKNADQGSKKYLCKLALVASTDVPIYELKV